MSGWWQALLLTVALGIVMAGVVGSSRTANAASGDPGVAAWGKGSDGQLGDGSYESSEVPVAVDTTGVLSGKTVAATDASGLAIEEGGHACVVADGKAYCWGNNFWGQLGNSSTANSAVPVAVDTSGVLAGKTVAAIATGSSHTCAVADGKAYCWGGNSHGELGTGDGSDSTTPVAVDTSGVLSGKTVTSVSAGFRSTCAVADGKVFCWGARYYGQLGDAGNPGTTSAVPVAVNTAGVLSGKTVTSVSSGADFSCGLAEGKVYCWGNNGAGELGNNSTTESAVPVAVDTSGVLSGKTVTSQSAGASHTCAVADGAAYCWGLDSDGQLGNNNTVNSAVPVAVDTSGVLSGKTVSSLSAGVFHTCAAADEKAYCWGSGKGWGALGTGSDSDSLVPVAVSTSGVLSRRPVTAVSAGMSHTVALYGQALPATLSGPPTQVSGAVGDGQVSVAWAAPADDGGSPILEYQVTATPGGKTCTTSGATTCVVSGLSNGQGYTFTVRARNAQGWSQPSAASAVVTPKAAVVSPPPATQPPANQPPVSQPPVLSAPAAVSGVKAVARKGKVTVTWKPVSGASSYEVRISKPGGRKYLAWKKVSATKFTAKVAKGKKYRVQVAPVGAGGQGPVKTVKFKG